MISKDDILSYLDETVKLEQQMIDTYQHLARNLTEEHPFKARLEALLKDEQVHSTNYLPRIRSLIAERDL